jgi:hypothetical protein
LRRFALASLVGLGLLLLAPAAWADKVAVLPFTAPKGLAKPEVDQVRAWARSAVAARGDTQPSDSEMLSAEMAVKDGSPDTSAEYRAAGRASGSQWTLTGRVDRLDMPPTTLPSGGQEPGYTVYRVELEACQVESGRVESLTRDVDPDEAETEVGEMLALLLRPEGLGTAEIPWQMGAPHKPKPKPPPPPVTPPPVTPPPPPTPPPAPAVRHAYAEGHPFALGASVGVTSALVTPDQARGPSTAVPIGATFAYAFADAPGLELRGVFTSQVVGPKAIEISAGGRYAIPVVPTARLFVGPELLLGTHVAIGAEKTARFLTHGSAFVSLGLGESIQLELAGDLEAALGGTGTLVLGGGTARFLVRF